MRHVLVFLLSSVVCFGQAMQLGTGVTGSYTVPATAPFTTLSTQRAETRIKDFGGCANNYTNLWDFGNQSLYIRCGLNVGSGGSGTALQFAAGNWGAACTLEVGGVTDFTIRMQLKSDGMHCELWTTSTATRITKAIVPATPATDNFSIGGHPIGAASGMTAKVVYMRWYTATVPDDGAMAPSVDVTADLGNWALNSDYVDSVRGGGMNLTMTGATLVSVPVYTPIVDVRPVTPKVATHPTIAVIRTGAALPLTGAGSVSFSETSSSLAYAWTTVSQVSGQILTYSPSNAAVASVGGAGAAGEYVVRLTVTDSLAQSAQVDFTFGAVAANSNGTINYGSAAAGHFFGKQIPWGESPWPYVDYTQLLLGEFYCTRLGNGTTAADDWNTALTGTVSVTHGSPTVTGSGTSFLTQFAGLTEIVIWYPVGDGRFGRRNYPISAVTDDTHITLSTVYQATAGATAGLNFSTFKYSASWVGDATNNDYYDVVRAFYILHARTGLSRFLTCARTLADRWWSQPYVDEGRSAWFGDDWGSFRLPPRRISLAGVLWRAVESGAAAQRWIDMGLWIDGVGLGRDPSVTIDDIRETGYLTLAAAQLALFDPDATRRTAWGVKLTARIGQWSTQQTAAPQKTWLGYPYPYWDDGKAFAAGPVTVANGSPTVTGTIVGSPPGTGWDIGVIGSMFLANGDSFAYKVIGRPNQSTLTLNRNYTGTSRTLSGTYNHAMGTLTGWGTQPFMLGIASQAFHYCYLAIASATCKTFEEDILAWEQTYGRRSATRGFYYGRNFPGCEPPEPAQANCVFYEDPVDSKASDRVVGAEIIGPLSLGYLDHGNTSTPAFVDDLYGALFGRDGGPNADVGFYPNELLPPTGDGKSKDFGFFFGTGNVTNWLGARLLNTGPVTVSGRVRGAVIR